MTTGRDNAVTPDIIRAEIIGTDRAVANGITITAYTPIIGLCRALVAAGCDPGSPLQAWRGPVLAVEVASIGRAAAVELNADGTGFRPRRAADAGPPMRQTPPAATRRRATTGRSVAASARRPGAPAPKRRAVS